MTEVLIVAAAFLYVTLRLLGLSAGLKGRRGERRVRGRLRRLCREGEYRLLNDIYISACGRESQIDHILIGKAGVFVIETKNYGGRITGGERDAEWTQHLGSEYTFYNPVRQNWGHIRALKNLLDGICPDYCFHSVVVFPSGTDLCTDTDKAVGLGDMEARIGSFRRDSLTSGQMADIESVIRRANIVSRRERRRYVRKIRRDFRHGCKKS